MALAHKRTQHAVGQGFFHTGEINENGSTFRYVFDCGSMSSYQVERADRINSYRASLPTFTQLDVLFISHAHADHLNGVEQLLKAKVTVDTIILPLLDVADRLIAYGRDLLNDAASSQNAFYRTFIVDPVAALARFNPRQILFVRAQHGDGGAPGSGDAPPYGPDRDRDPGRPPTEARLGWKLLGSGRSTLAVSPKVIKAGEPIVDTIDDTQALAVPLQEPWFWLLAPYVDPTVTADRSHFMKALAAKLRAAGAKSLAAKVKNLDASDMEMIVIQYSAVLASAYAEINKDLNATSLCLYSGPLPQAQMPKFTYQAVLGKWWIAQFEAERVAWLTTGDAALKQPKRRKPFLNHYGNLLKQVTTLTLPHHGSDENFDAELITAIEPIAFVAAADRYRNWRHPGSAVVQAVASFGRSVSVVTSQVASTVYEEVYIR
jgi:hypothetical protein